MIYMRGHPQDYRDWAKAAGPDWDWPQVRQVFKDLEDNRGITDDHHGQGGPLTVSDLAQPNALSRAFVEAGSQLQFPANPDFNGAAEDGVGLYQVTQRGGRRFSSARAFLDPIRDRPNLSLITGAQVQQVLFLGRRATGVQLNGRALNLEDGGEVILCGGAVNSPQLLMLSGIGPGRRGGRIRPLRPQPGPAQPAVPLHSRLSARSRPSLVVRLWPDTACLRRSAEKSRADQPCNPRSDAAPRIEAGYLSHPDDLPTLLSGLKIARAITSAPALTRRISHETLPGPQVITDARMEADIRARAETIYHPVGTCRMGNDSSSVTDPHGLVRGGDGLRVVDASLMPQIIAGNTNAPTMMIAETIARWLAKGQT